MAGVVSGGLVCGQGAPAEQGCRWGRSLELCAVHGLMVMEGRHGAIGFPLCMKADPDLEFAVSKTRCFLLNCLLDYTEIREAITVSDTHQPHHAAPHPCWQSADDGTQQISLLLKDPPDPAGGTAGTEQHSALRSWVGKLRV